MREKDDINVSIGARIKELRKEKGLTQDKLAELVNICTAQQISDIERGFCGISVPKLMTFCSVLETDADYLLFGMKSNNIDSAISKYLSRMTTAQARCVEELVAVYAKSCGIKIENDKE